MSSHPPISNSPNYTQRIHKGKAAKYYASRKQTTANCLGCNRFMVPRIISYYGQPLRSICPFCGTTYAKFPSVFQRLLRPFQENNLSFTPLKWLTAITLALGLLSCIDSWWLSFPNRWGLYIFLSSICLGMLTLVELFIQSVNHLAAKLGHKINYYWGGFFLVTVVARNMRPDLQFYISLGLFVIFMRWFILGCMRILISFEKDNYT